MNFSDGLPIEKKRAIGIIYDMFCSAALAPVSQVPSGDMSEHTMHVKSIRRRCNSRIGVRACPLGHRGGPSGSSVTSTYVLWGQGNE